ncbi:50S ribosomal protein L22 [Candidatus Curtissbacteria bacterium RIFCSPHIGHO2_01_FULL_41_44]|uniref:Large ribosomal subunit protein uL22 n=1 Tax=Candidatus Curtissbacteria bacterium RIFCSPLOWO2_01_FULL_42_50 TaxID=1797730 RepID=A0A1F5H2E3_9BACT|nr:MAG: 50S ribosomal protein L22 [Candidatus Curtissbacteria bacterium RIFCSPHIGHO2_02_FULL_42_58]OGD94767.1 MAG: 50S ribosomal protein L22 [Candidatus Curtissbacteria bacterium RIFCSPHIGHO2_01_FULL_41_44]OGD96311.1 MAG: 50S ribosomal protein L22 [Candidatus Curtissbacteria bacterium RIFCSPHIGHO2_12_FULL_42_33]OGD98330.1 MAG: 50S ribosomal protein L22 [Candidatus Curtissbacteria bacterium RIFCSPLOWO2_01_FULL_42_50]OGE02967.1 MAG: 50S ribosomal protein L22 [Candidatus Curtissbacteria bacterium 
MEVTAVAKSVRVSPEKVRLVVDQIKKTPPQKAVQILNFVNKRSAPILKKVIASAIANAKNNFNLDQNSLAFKEILVGKGPVFKRFRAVARGRAHPILRRTSHIRVILEGETKNTATAYKVSKDNKVVSENQNSKIKMQSSKLQ